MHNFHEIMEIFKMKKRFFSVRMVLLFVLINVLLLLTFRKSDVYVLSVIHINDFHDRFEEITLSTAPCRPGMTNCIGGFSRTYAKIAQLRSLLPDPLVLNLGDNFIGTLWSKHYRWNVTQYFMNMINFNVTILGNHDFDNGLKDVIEFAKAMNSPFVLSNVDAIKEPEFDENFSKTFVIERLGKRIGFIGLLIKAIKEKARMGNLKLLDEIETVRMESERLKKEEHCDIIIVLSHCGRDIDEKIAVQGGAYISLIIGSHSHELYHNGILPEGSGNPVSVYPGVFIQPSGRQVLIVQANFASKFVGHLTVHFDSENEPVFWEGNTEFLGTDQPKDPKIDQLLSDWKMDIDKVAYKKLGKTVTKLDGINCRMHECNLGNLFTDILYDEAMKNNQPMDIISLFSSGAIKGSIESGEILYMDLIGAWPFEDYSIMFDIKGQYILETLQISSAQDFKANSTYFFAPDLIQVNGLMFTINATKPNFKNIENVKTTCDKCAEGSKVKPLDLKKTYRVIAPEFFLDPIDGFKPLSKNYRNILKGNKCVDTIINYIKKNSPINAKTVGRLTIVR